MLLAFTFYLFLTFLRCFQVLFKKKKRLHNSVFFGDTFYYFIFCVLTFLEKGRFWSHSHILFSFNFHLLLILMNITWTESKQEPSGPLAAFSISCYMGEQTSVKLVVQGEVHLMFVKISPKSCFRHCIPSFLSSPAPKPFGTKGEIHPKGLIAHLVGFQGVFICLCLQYGTHCAESREKCSSSCRNMAGCVNYLSHFPFLSLPPVSGFLFLTAAPKPCKPYCNACWPPDSGSL